MKLYIFMTALLVVPFTISAANPDISPDESMTIQEECNLGVMSFDMDYERISKAISEINEADYRSAIYFMTFNGVDSKCNEYVSESKRNEISKMIDVAVKINNGTISGAFPNKDGKPYVYKTMPINEMIMILEQKED